MAPRAKIRQNAKKLIREFFVFFVFAVLLHDPESIGKSYFRNIFNNLTPISKCTRRKNSPKWDFRPFSWVPVLMFLLFLFKVPKLVRRQVPQLSWPKGRHCCGGGPKKSRAEEVNNRNSAKWPHDEHEETRTKRTDIKRKESRAPQNGKKTEFEETRIKMKIVEGHKSCCTDNETLAEKMQKTANI